MDVRKINIQKETPSLQDFIQKYVKNFVRQSTDGQFTANIVPNALDYMRMGTVFIPVVYEYETKTFTIIKGFHTNLIYTLGLWLIYEIELKDSFVEDEIVKSIGYRRKTLEKYLQVDVIIKDPTNHKEVETLIKLYNQL